MIDIWKPHYATRVLILFSFCRPCRITKKIHYYNTQFFKKTCSFIFVSTGQEIAKMAFSGEEETRTKKNKIKIEE